MEKTVIILSGGIDSTTLLYDIIKQGYDVSAISFDYNQKHKKELELAKITTKKLGIEHKILDLSILNEIAPSALTRDNWKVPEGHYEAENMKETVISNRNMVMLSLAGAYAMSIKASKLFYGAHAGDHAIYPDCRKEFVDSMKVSIGLADWNKLELEAPYIDIDKGDIVIKGLSLNVPYEDTWTCYNGLELACAKCGSCQERLEAFLKAGIDDPLKYV